jgi:hypothetical protein
MIVPAPESGGGGGWMASMTKQLDNIIVDPRRILTPVSDRNTVVEKRTDQRTERTERAAPSEKLSNLQTFKSSRAQSIPANIGSMTIAIVGDSGIGKTSFVQAFMNISERSRVCEDHLEKPNSNMEYYKFSTVPDSQLFTQEEKYNVTLVDTAGYSSYTNAADIIRPSVDFLQRQFENTDKVFTPGFPIPNLSKFLNSGTGKSHAL